jgi:hypothetical protein
MRSVFRPRCSQSLTICDISRHRVDAVYAINSFIICLPAQSIERKFATLRAKAKIATAFLQAA